MVVAGLVFAAVAALIHLYIFVMESLTWTSARTRATFGIRSLEEAQATKAMAFNQGFYNLFLAVAALLGIVLVAAGITVVGATLVFVGTGSMVAAGLVLLLSNRRMLRPAAIQAVPPLIAIILLALGLAV
jgi:putative membrane protein